MSTPDSGLELYELHHCPYCAKVRNALDDLELEYESHNVPNSRKKRTEVQAISGQSGVPVLVDSTNGIDGMAESDDIVAYLYETYGDGEQGPSGIVSRIRSTVF